MWLVYGEGVDGHVDNEALAMLVMAKKEIEMPFRGIAHVTVVDVSDRCINSML